MRKLGFNKGWISKTRTCVTIVSYATLINGQLSSVIIPSRDLLQRDIISPYLYLICDEGLSMTLNEAEKPQEL